ncbi:MAG: 50S ribosomal protein L17 [Kiritimatiellia bacterium]|nr:50S ribosomal protein L17 [Kiritimatiellia bacterium]MDP6849296.1 50S ribosomal protein L17 [Kiritimatiellia bacterium]
MRHRKQDTKLGRSSAHRKATMASLVCHLITEKQIKTTLAKAKQARKLAERMVTLGRKAAQAETPEAKLAARRLAISRLNKPKPVGILFDDMISKFEGRQGGYTRILKLGRRRSDGSEMALLEWVGVQAVSKKKKKADKTEKTEEAS